VGTLKRCGGESKVQQISHVLKGSTFLWGLVVAMK
jgi:hypothetical protein